MASCVEKIIVEKEEKAKKEKKEIITKQNRTKTLLHPHKFIFYEILFSLGKLNI